MVANGEDDQSGHEDGAGAAAVASAVRGHPAPRGYTRYQATQLATASTRVEAPATSFQVAGPLHSTVMAKCARRRCFPISHLLPSRGQLRHEKDLRRVRQAYWVDSTESVIRREHRRPRLAQLRHRQPRSLVNAENGSIR
jgi:hypothetical protein